MPNGSLRPAELAAAGAAYTGWSSRWAGVPEAMPDEANGLTLSRPLRLAGLPTWVASSRALCLRLRKPDLAELAGLF